MQTFVYGYKSLTDFVLSEDYFGSGLGGRMSFCFRFASNLSGNNPKSLSMAGRDYSPEAPQPARVFATTHWSMVLAAARGDSNHASNALEHLCRAYWYPLYAYVRRRGYSAHDAQDLTQAFFERLLKRHWVGDADRELGRFRTFLLTAMSRFLSGEWDRLRAEKRGGGVPHLPIQINTAEARYGFEPANHSTPEQCYERRWALTLLDNVLQQLSDEYGRGGKAELFAALNQTLQGSRESQPYGKLAKSLGMSEGAVKVAVCRLRKRYRQLLRAEIAQTMADSEDVDEELKHLFAVLSRP